MVPSKPIEATIGASVRAILPRRRIGALLVAVIIASCGGGGDEGGGGSGNTCSNGQDVHTDFTYANATVTMHVGTAITAFVPSAPGIPASCLPSTRYSLASGSLPPGLVLDPHTGVITGTPTTAGSYTYEVRLSLDGFVGSVSNRIGVYVDDPALFTFSAWTSHPSPASDNLRLDVIGANLVVTTAGFYTGTMDTFVSANGGANWGQVLTTGPTPFTKHFSGTSDGTAVYLSGGTTDAGAYTSHVWKFDGSTWAERTAAGAFAGRRDHAMAKVGTTLFVIGGSNAQGVLGDVWKSVDDGVTWTLASTPFAPRTSACALSFGGKLLVIGGTNGVSNLAEVWESADGVTWTRYQDAPSGSPFRSISTWSQQCAAMDGRVYFLSSYYTVSSQNLVDWQFEPGFLDNSPAPGAVALNGRLYAIKDEGTTSCRLMESSP